jgi:hypothetical protein
LSLLQEPRWIAEVCSNWSAELQLGSATDLDAFDADLEIGAL